MEYSLFSEEKEYSCLSPSLSLSLSLSLFLSFADLSGLCIDIRVVFLFMLNLFIFLPVYLTGSPEKSSQAVRSLSNT